MTIDAVIAKNPPNPSIFAVCFLEPDECAGATEVFDSLIFPTPFKVMPNDSKHVGFFFASSPCHFLLLMDDIVRRS